MEVGGAAVAVVEASPARLLSEGAGAGDIRYVLMQKLDLQTQRANTRFKR